MRVKTIFFFFAFFFSVNIFGQVMDQVYIRENPARVRTEPNAYLLKYYLPEMENPHGESKLDSVVKNISLDFPKQSMKFDDCVYFDAVMTQCFLGPGERFIWNNLFQIRTDVPSRVPPSLRFSTDGNKNYVDSLFSMHLFPKVKLEKYAEPFYFKKFEVTNAEYREFVNFVKDSIARRLLGDVFDEYYLARYDDNNYYDIDTTENARHIHFSDQYKLNNKEKVHWEDNTDPDYYSVLDPLYLPAEQRFWHRKEIDVRKLNYEYYTDTLGIPIPFPWKWDDRTDRNTIKDVINVYPDTLAWVHDFPYDFVEPMTNVYFWHPSFDNYPVVGITWRQAKAFLNWKTIEEQKKLDAKGIKLKVVYDLPTEMEWEIAATSEMEDGKINSYGKNFAALADNSWTTDLMLDSSEYVNEKYKIVVDSTCKQIDPLNDVGAIYLEDPHAFPYSHTDSTFYKDGKEYEIKTTYCYWSKPRNLFLNENNWNGKYSPDNYIFTSPANLQKVKKITGHPNPNTTISVNKIESPVDHDNSEILKQVDGNGISFMGGNVSEWLNEDYSNWLPAFLTRLKMLHSIPSPDAQMEYQRETYFDSFNSKNGKLVRGGNWFDERYSSLRGKNPEGTNAKCFVDPDADHCTLGFRYVIRVTRK